MQFGSSCYLSLVHYKSTWKECQDTCTKKGGHLWTINSHEEWKNVFTKTLKNLAALVGLGIEGIFDPLSSPYTFIGLIRDKTQHNTLTNVS